MSSRTAAPALVVRDSEIMGATPVFAGTRVPIETLVDYLEGGYNLEEFFDNFPSVTREQAQAALEVLRQALLSC